MRTIGYLRSIEEGNVGLVDLCLFGLLDRKPTSSFAVRACTLTIVVDCRAGHWQSGEEGVSVIIAFNNSVRYPDCLSGPNAIPKLHRELVSSCLLMLT